MPARGKRRALGQHFLKDRRITQLIADTSYELAKHYGCKAMLEIGPGKGAITEPLLKLLADGTSQGHSIQFLLSEKDWELAHYWKNQNLRVEEGDFLDLPTDRWLVDRPLAIASNLPYSAGTAILTRLARHQDAIPFMVLMFQAEVAERLRAQPDTKAWGSLSIWIQNRWEVKKLCHVGPGAFSPPPEVESEVVILKAREKPLIAIQDEKLWEHLLKSAFAHRRKMLRSTFKGTPHFKEALDASGIDGTKRAEALTWEEWEKLYQTAQR